MRKKPTKPVVEKVLSARRQKDMTVFDRRRFYGDIEKIAESRGLSLRALAKESGVGVTTLSRLKTMDRAPEVSNFLLLCEWGGLDPLGYLTEEARLSVQTKKD